MKRIDKLMIKQFIGPFTVTFGIAMFVLVMQALWEYMERIAGKGLSFFTIVELLSYKCVGLVPLALPLGLLISSVMVLGGMAEHFELSSIKSSGTSLLRVMRTLIIFGVLSAAASFSISDYVIPAANLQFGARMYDINQKKPTLNMEPGTFNADFNQYTIRLGKRDTDGRTIENVMIYDHTKATTGQLGQILAKTGEMYSSADGGALIMELNQGVQYTERRPSGGNKSSFPFIRTYFDKYEKVFDLSQFDMGQTDVSLFETNRSMLTTTQLQVGVDSITKEIEDKKQRISNQITSYLPLLPQDTIDHWPNRTKDKDRQDDYEDKYGKRVKRGQDSTGTLAANIRDAISRENQTDIMDAAATASSRKRANARSVDRAAEHPIVVAASDWPGVYDLILLAKKENRTRVFNRTRSGVRSITSQAGSTERILPGIYENRVKYIYDKHMKYSMALVCIVFIFIGAPMGAIVRKGGFGFPILISIIFFVIFIILTIFCRKLAESFVVTAAVAGWLPCLVLFPVSLYITRRAMEDAKLVSTDGIKRAWAWVRGGFGRKVSA